MELKAKSIKVAPVGKLGPYTLDYACEHGIGFYYEPLEGLEVSNTQLEQTPKEMFEELGYEQKPFSNDVITYINKEFPRDSITFYLEEKHFEKSNDFGVSVITLQELKAIIKQAQELGWF